LDNSDDAVFACSHAGIILTWNRGTEAIFGHTAEGTWQTAA
jgi:PAS domain S-box-containing protein